MKTILSGVKPTGRPHIGNYFGAMRQLVDMQKDYHVYAMAVDYHALISVHEAKILKQDTVDLVIDYLAIGIDPERTLLFKQSEVPEHTELAWILNCITTVPYMMRAHAYKDAVAKGEEVNVGLFSYPILMAADILMYDIDKVPVGKDNKQHLEMAREIARKFNTIFGETFKEPEEFIMEEVAIVPGTDGKKMSKSYGNTISLFATDEEIEEKVMSIVTDSKAEYPENVFYIHKLFRPTIELDKIYEENKGKYKAIKEILIGDLKNFIKPLREKREEIAKNLDFVNKVLAEGKEKARAVASAKMQTVKKAIGVL
ncbi:MAG: Tryptophan-tRNA ligase [Candidatus Woesebacteria bacterium GW2011_GWA1_39_8]|uniref:Tryptophan--tRNA ligase n=1 Tax=Candidatus Woesebacteria bacterium GW2011_GWA1_39_8 TaxID=1618552 RepID=A0A0G0PJG7_9BACT|nr:MAG: Tryptophan-tRNA ligase [Candidatus Woesebacteria bacterium GW2011_GWA1_39_8]